MGDSRIKDVSTLLAAFFDEEQRRKGGQYSAFFGSWKQIAGERLAAHSKVRDIENGILIVEAEHPGWVQLLQFRQAQMLESARRLFPELELRGISFRLGRDAGARAASGGAGRDGGESRPGPFGPGGRPPAGEVGPAEAAEAVSENDAGPSSLEDIKDGELRALLGSLKRAVEGEESRDPS